jgi:hypothetical protein
MKSLLILFLVSCAFAENINLVDNMSIALESGVLANFYIAYSGRDCLNIHEGRCGMIYGLNIPLSASTTGVIDYSLLNKYSNIQWTLVKSQDFFCLRSVGFDAFLELDGANCLNRTSDVQCGRLYLHRLATMTCSNLFGWRIVFIGNYYALQSVQFPNVYLYFNLSSCQHMVASSRFMRRCGIIQSHFFRNVSAINTSLLSSNVLYRWIFFNIHPITLATAIHH